MGVAESPSGNRIVIIANEEDQDPDTVQSDNFPSERISNMPNHIGKAKAIDLEAPEGMSLVSIKSSDFINSSFYTSNFNEIFPGENFHGLKVVNVRGSMASISYKGVIRLVDLNRRPLLVIDGIVIRAYAFRSEGDEVDGMCIEGFQLHSVSLGISFALKVTNPVSALEALPFSKTELENMAKLSD